MVGSFRFFCAIGFVYLFVAPLSLCNSNVVEWLPSGSTLQFDASEAFHVGLLNRLHWVQKNERDTKKEAVSIWEKADLYLLEWPGNVTLFKPEDPMVKWGRHRAKYIEDQCAEDYTGIEMRAYAFEYVYLTWGPHRLTKTYTPPLTIPKSILPQTTLGTLSNTHSYDEHILNVVVVYDMAFAYDCLLLAYSYGVIRVSELEMGWAEVSQIPRRPLKYALSEGITESVDKLVVQSCCVKTDFCPFGNFVVAYKELSLPHRIYVSSNGGKTFRKLHPLSDVTFLLVVLPYPEFDYILVFHGRSKNTTADRMIISLDKRGHPNEFKFKHMISTSKALQGSRLGLEASFVLWDDCNVWYSPDAGLQLTRSIIYLHRKIVDSGPPLSLHVIKQEQCTFGENSILAVGKAGKFGLLDSKNVFYLGVDSKSNLSQLVALKMDMSLIPGDKQLAITPSVDFLEHPKLLYPPKFLEVPNHFQKVLDLGRKYLRRLGMRLLAKNVYPSDFIQSFYEENIIANNSKILAELALKPCQTSSLSVNNSITQMQKFYFLKYGNTVKFTIRFKSKLDVPKQLRFEPLEISSHLKIRMKLASVDSVEPEDPKFWIKYVVHVQLKSPSSTEKLYRVNFYTKGSLRCNFLPRVTVFFKAVHNVPRVSDVLSERDMSRKVYLKSVTTDETKYLGKQKYGETIKVSTCSAGKT